MMSLFSSFDLNYFSYSIFMLLILSLLVMNFTQKTSSILIFMTYLYTTLEEFFFSLKPQSFSKFFSYFVIIFMMGFFFLNFLGVWPYNFSLTSQAGPIFFLAVVIWVSIVAFSIVNNSKGFLSHLVPEGAPINLTWFLFLIELVSSTIRPLTLSIRLMANILAGHLLMILLFSLVSKIEFFFPAYILLNLVELFVSVIQAYIFFTLVCLYFSEI